MAFLLALVLTTLVLSGIGVSTQPQLVWTREAPASSVSLGPTGVYVAGGVEVRRYGFDGNLVWTRQIGTPGADQVFAVAVGSTALYVVGQIGSNAFVGRYDFDGNRIWVRQFDAGASRFGLHARASTVSLDATGVYVAGATSDYGYFNDDLNYSFVAKFDANGTEMWTRSIGCCSSDATGISVGPMGVFVAGYEVLGHYADTRYLASVWAMDLNGAELWTRLFWSPSSCDNDDCQPPDAMATGVSLERTGIYVSGWTYGTFAGQVNQGDRDGFVRKYDLNGNELWTRQFGTSNTDIAWGIDSTSAGVFVVGTAGAHWQSGPYGSEYISNAFVKDFDSNGNEIWSLTLGKQGLALAAQAVSASPRGVFLASTSLNFTSTPDFGVSVAGSSFIAKVCTSPSCLHN